MTVRINIVFGFLSLVLTAALRAYMVTVIFPETARRNTTALLALNSQLGQQAKLDAIKGGPQAHGNLEALLNIAAGLCLARLAGAPLLKWTISLLFLLGTLLHASMLCLSIVFELRWAEKVLATAIGPLTLLVALLLTCVAIMMRYREGAVVT